MGAQSSQRQADALPVSQIASLFKCSQYKNPGVLKRIQQDTEKMNQEQKLINDVLVDEKYMDTVQADVEASLNQSNFSRVSPQIASVDLTAATQMISSFLIGPQFPSGSSSHSHVDVYAPYVWIKTKDGKLNKF